MSLRLFVGIDWGSRIDDVCALNAKRERIGEWPFEHSGRGAEALCAKLLELSDGKPEEVAIAIEAPHGLLVDTLLCKGFQVFSLNPKQVDRFRDRCTVAGAKDDRLDAFVLADGLATDLRLYRRLEVENPLVVMLRENSRLEEQLGHEVSRLCNRLREQLMRFLPALMEVSPAADDPWLWSLLEKAPSWAALRKLKPFQVRDVLKQHRVRSVKEREVVDLLRRDPPLPVAATAQAACDHIATLIPMLHVVHAQRAVVQKRLGKLLEELQDEGSSDDDPGDAAIVMSFPGVAKIVGSILLGETFKPIRERDLKALRTVSGVAPVTRRSGQPRGVRSMSRPTMRRACNPRVRTAVYHWARVSTQRVPGCRALYDDLKKKGHRHARALRSVGDQLLRALVGALKSRSVFDASRFARKSSTVLPGPTEPKVQKNSRLESSRPSSSSKIAGGARTA